MKKLLFAAAALAFATSASATTIDPHSQLTGPTPLTGSFAFGTVNPTTGALTPFNNLETPCFGNAAATCLRNNGDGLPVAGASTVAFGFGTVNFPGDRIFLHPTDGAFVGLSFLAAVAGTYRFAGEFSIQDAFSPTGVDTGAVILNGATLLPSALLGSGSRAFDFTTTLGAGDVVSFFVGSAGNQNFDSSGLSLRVTDFVGGVPEPSTWLMMILGFGIVGGTLRSRRRVKTGLAAAWRWPGVASAL